MAQKETLKIVSPIIFHEPILNISEVNILKALNTEVHKTNLEGKCLLTDAITLVYLPHCPKQLTNNLLWKNWSSAINNLILICNSFTQLFEATPKRFLEPDASYITQILPYTKEVHLNNTFKYSDIFNDTSVHCFDTTQVPTEFWKSPPEPIYSDQNTELISRQLIAELTIN